MKLKNHFIRTLCLIIITACVVPAIGSADIQTEAMPLAVIPEPAYESPTVVEGQDVIHDFIIQNQGTAVLKVERVKTG